MNNQNTQPAAPAPHYYVSTKTGNRYVSGRDCGRVGLDHWRKGQRLRVTVTQTGEPNWRERRPLVELETILGAGAHYTPETLRELAATFRRIADDADAHPMGPRTFWRSDRGYDVSP